MPPIALPNPNKIYVQTSSQEQAKELPISSAAKALTIPLIDPFLCLTVILLYPSWQMPVSPILRCDICVKPVLLDQ